MAAGSLGSLVVSLTAETAQFTAALDKASYTAEKNFRNISSFAKTAAGSLAALYGASSIVGFVKTQIDAADATGKMAQKVGISVEELSKLQYAAKLADVDTGQLQVGLVKLSKGMVEAANGTGQARNALSAMGISVKNTDGTLKSSSTVLGEIADKFSTYEDSANKTAIATQLFGKSGAELIPLLNAGSKGIKESADELERFGAVITEKAAIQAERFNDNLTRLSTVGSVVGKTIANEVIPYLNQLAEEFLVARANGMGFMDMLQMGFRTGDYKEQIAKINEEISKIQNNKMNVLFPDSVIQKDIQNLERQRTVLETLVKAREKADNPPKKDEKKTTAPFSVDLEKMEKEAEKYAKGLASAQEANTKFSTSISEMAAKAQADIAGMFMTDAQKKQQQDLISINKSFLDTQAGITKQYTEGKLTLQAYNEQMAILGGQYQYATGQANSIYEKQEQLNGSYMYGASIALARYSNESKNLANLSNGIVTNSLRSVEDGLFNMITNSQNAAQAFSNMVTSILSDIAKLMIRQAIVSPIVGAITGAIAGGATGSMGYGSATVHDYSTPYSGGGRAAGGDVMGGTSYLVGERGAEIFTPSMNGVITPNSSLGGNNNVVVNVNMQNGSVNAEEGNKLGILIGNVVKSELIKQKRAGGILA
jgi:lambda family phage tail tape measure protein